MSSFYAVVYGNEWEDIMYFSDFERAKRKLIVQSVNLTSFVPVMIEYNKNESGVFGRSKHEWHVDQSIMQIFVQKYTSTEIYKNPDFAITSIAIN